MRKKEAKPGAVELEAISKKVTQRRKDAKQKNTTQFLAALRQPAMRSGGAWREILFSSYGVLR